MLVFITFVTLLVLTSTRSTLLRIKKLEDWVLDSVGLFFQGIMIPILQISFVYQIYQYCFPSMKTSLNLHPVLGFILSFVLVDYLYYWNHRLFHTRYLWCIHQVHHTMTNMDVLGTSRNTLWTSLFIVYLWVHSFFIYLLQDSTWYVLGVSLTSALDLWRHSNFGITGKSWLYYCLYSWLILPQDHAWHHASHENGGNYGANLKIWDKIHGTYLDYDDFPDSLGVETKLSLSQKLLLPF